MALEKHAPRLLPAPCGAAAARIVIKGRFLTYVLDFVGAVEARSQTADHPGRAG